MLSRAAQIASAIATHPARGRIGWGAAGCRGGFGSLSGGCNREECVARLDRTAANIGDQADLDAARDASFEEYVAGVSGRLFTMALLLTGRHRAEAEDLLQDVLERAYRRWGRITRNGDPDAGQREI